MLSRIFWFESTLNPPEESAGFIQSFTQDSAKHRYYQRFQIAEPYVQDDLKVTHNLTLNLGLRISLFGTYQGEKSQCMELGSVTIQSQRDLPLIRLWRASG